MKIEEIMEECKTYDIPKMVDGLEKNPDVQSIDTGDEKVTLWSETDVRNDIMKSIALMAGTAACAYFDLMAAALYIPLGIGCLCYACFKYGVFKGRNEE